MNDVLIVALLHPFVAETPVTAIISAVATFLMAIIALITYIARAIFEYLVKRIQTLEAREQEVLSGMLDSIENISVSAKTTADFTLQLVENMRYEERKKAERGAT